MHADPEYQKRIQAQIDQYATIDGNMHSIPDIASYFRNNFIKQHTKEIFDASGVTDFYAKPMIRSIERTGSPKIASIGSGDGTVELQIAKFLDSRNVDFRFTLFELSPILLEKAERNFHRAGLAHRLDPQQVDINTWSPSTEYACYMAHHSLHHIQSLERLFDGVRASVLGNFVTMDMIGRNGHMCWPEVLDIVERIWAFLPPEKRQHYVLKGYEKQFINWDCSKQGFEGIRAQDILPLLLTRFGFEGFLGFGGLIDPFVGRGFGRHYNVEISEDRAFIDFLGYINDILLDLGHIKPTKMFAVMTKDLNAPTKYVGRRTPVFSIRQVGCNS
ncbi:MAG TPA: hypothetical protein PKY87_04320 [Terricaulis sp.]|nr:hypothetical protein [Terricaulis sp.]